MPSAPVANVPPQNESRGARKKKAKADATTTASSEAIVSEDSKDVDVTPVNGADGPNDSPYLRELSKNIRNVKKKLTGTQKTDTIIAENPGKTLDQLLAEKKINADQKAQAEKKPALQASLEQLENQLEHYKKFDEDSQKRFATEKASLQQHHAEEIRKIRDKERAEAKEAAEKLLEEKLLTLSRFLRAAAAKRSDGEDTAEENLAFEGALLLIYGGDKSAAQAMVKLIEGSEDIVPSVEGQPSNFTFKHVRDVSVESAPTAQPPGIPYSDDAHPAESASATPEETTLAIRSDPTVTNAGLTEIDASGEIRVNGDEPQAETKTVPEASSVDNGAANAVAEANWDSKMSQSMTSGPDGFEMVEVPRDPAETETGLEATPAATTTTQSWAEDVPTEPAPSAGPANDGFHEVHHGRGRGRGHGDFRGGRGRGRGEGFRGRGRGDRGGRGRGQRGGRGRGFGANGPGASGNITGDAPAS